MGARKKLPCKDQGYEFEVPLFNKDGRPSLRTTKMRIKTVFKFSDTKFSYYLERYIPKTGEWLFIRDRTFDHNVIKKYFKD